MYLVVGCLIQISVFFNLFILIIIMIMIVFGKYFVLQFVFLNILFCFVFVSFGTVEGLKLPTLLVHSLLECN